MFLPELEPDVPGGHRLGRFTDLPGCRIRAAKVHSNLRRHGPVEARHVRLVAQPVTHRREEPVEVGPAKVRSTPELSERVDLLADGVEVDVGGGIVVEPLREVCVDAQKLDATLAGGNAGGLGLERGQEGLEPFEGGGVFADPDELDPAETAGRVRA